MAADDILKELRAAGPRSAGSDAERRAALVLARELRGGGRVRVETFWCHPNWALAASWHVALGLLGSLLSVSSPKLGGALVLAAMLCLIADGLLSRSPGRLLTPLRATQNVVWTPPAPDPAPGVTLVLTSGLDSPRGTLLDRPAGRRLRGRLRALAGPAALGWAGSLVALLVVVLLTAIARAGGHRTGAVGVVQLIPTIALVLGLALLLEAAGAGPDPDASVEADAGVAATVSLARALRAAPPANLAIELVIQGAASGNGFGLRHHLGSRRGALRASTAVVLGIAPSGDGIPVWWESDGALIPLRPLAPMRRLPKAGLQRVRGRGTTPSYPAFVRRIPALSIGTIGGDAEAAVENAVDRLRGAGLALVDEIDEAIVARRTAGRVPPAEPGRLRPG